MGDTVTHVLRGRWNDKNFIRSIQLQEMCMGDKSTWNLNMWYNYMNFVSVIQLQDFGWVI